MRDLSIVMSLSHVLMLLSLHVPFAESIRLDAALVSRGLCSSRAHAKSAIQAGRVTVDGVSVSKVAFSVDAAAAVLQVRDNAESRYVSRAGEKLRAALEAFDIDATGCHILDVGASTGGFTDCLLDAGASSATCVDCGHGQLHARLQQDPRVTSFEGTNARTLSGEKLPRSSFELIVVDVSFISLTLVLPALWALLDKDAPGARLVALVKPQFEAVALLGKTGRDALDKGKGVLRDEAVQGRILNSMVEFTRGELEECVLTSSMESSLRGGDGNREFLISLAHASHDPPRGPFYSSGSSTDAAAHLDSSAEVPSASSVPSAADAASVDTTKTVERATRKPSAAARAAAYARNKEEDSLRKARRIG